MAIFATVLILVVVEDGLVHDDTTEMLNRAKVLILVVVEDGLVQPAVLQTMLQTTPVMS